MARRARRAHPSDVREAFRMIACPGGPILEVPTKGSYIFERLSPGTIREEDFYEEFRIKRVGKESRGPRILVACPRGHMKKGKCTKGLRTLRIWHKRAGLKTLLRQCKSGELHERRAREIEKIKRDIDHMKKGESVEGLGAVTARKLVGPIFLSAVFAVIIIQFLFPGVL
jgi:hypothetical protein